MDNKAAVNPADTSPAVHEKTTGIRQLENLTIEYAVEGEVLLCRPVGRIDTISAPALLEVLEQNSEGVKEVKVDAEKLEYLSSAGLRAFLLAEKKLGKVLIVNPSEVVKEIVETTGFYQMIESD